MKNFILLFTAALLASFSVNAFDTNSRINVNDNNYIQAFIFNENGVEFSVYSDGHFDFYVNNMGDDAALNVNYTGVNISFNTGYDYDLYLQYDDYGAVVQIKDVPVYYDYYGRINQVGDTYIDYTTYGKISSIGKLSVHYDDQGNYVNSKGYINHYNKSYTYHPFHAFFTLPVATKSVVYNKPYRKFYTPYRISYHLYRNNYYKEYDKPYKDRYYYRPNKRIARYKRTNKRIARYYNGIRSNKARNIGYRDSDRRAVLCYINNIASNRTYYRRRYLYSNPACRRKNVGDRKMQLSNIRPLANRQSNR